MLTTLLMVGGGAAFLAWPSAVHLLGDGYLLLRDLPFGTSRISRVHTMAWAPPMQPWGGGRILFQEGARAGTRLFQRRCDQDMAG
tara:strand:- start:14588 stop:14842 length:255 start_codon:yes stop_codon:yes gene_type:complete